MLATARRVAPPILSLAILSAIGAPAWAQFEEPDTVPRFSIGPSVEIVFRGERGVSTLGGAHVSFGGGPVVGARLDFRLTRTLAIGARGSWGRLDEQRESTGIKQSSPKGLTQWQAVGELMLKVKPTVPGYFIIGGGARHIVPDVDDPVIFVHNTTPFTDVMGILGAGVALVSRSSYVLKLDFRFYLVSPAEQERIDTKGMALDFAMGLGLMFRL